jgi:hypothetical protein
MFVFFARCERILVPLQLDWELFAIGGMLCDTNVLEGDDKGWKEGTAVVPICALWCFKV